jgi:DNA-binding IscR family transcriptional regulator
MGAQVTLLDSDLARLQTLAVTLDRYVEFPQRNTQGSSLQPIKCHWSAVQTHENNAHCSIFENSAKAGILQTTRGAGGGIRLARKPENITLLEGIEAIDGPIQINECLRREGVCLFEDNCLMQSVWYD